MPVDDVLCCVAEALLWALLCVLFGVRDATRRIWQELDRALQRWCRAASDVTGRPSRRLRLRPRPRHQRLAWHLWHQLRRRLSRRHLALHRRPSACSQSVWGGASRPCASPTGASRTCASPAGGWPLSLTSDYHSDGGGDPPSTWRAPAAGADQPLTAAGPETSLSSAYSWDAEPSPRSLPSSRPDDSAVVASDAPSDVASSASWSSVHDSDCQCSLRLLQLSAKHTNRVPKSASRRRGAPDRCFRRRLTLSQRDDRRWRDVSGRRPPLAGHQQDGYRSTDDEMDGGRGAPPTPGFHHLKTPMSFSMSSLQQLGCHTPDTTALRLRTDRPYSSLCRKRKERSTDPSHRQSWGSEVSKEAFWEALQPSYAFLMEHQLIESCKEANGDLTWDATDVPGMDSEWSFCEFMDQYTELYDWLTQVQSVIYSSPKNITDRRLRESHMEEIERKSYRRKLLGEQSVRLQLRQPHLRDEVGWRLAHLSNKWDTLLHCVRPPSPSAVVDPDMVDIGADVAHEVRCLDRWFRHMDGQLAPISFRIDLRSTEEAADRLKQYQALHDEIKYHHRIVSGVGRLCGQLADETDRPADRRRLARLAARLDTSWQQIFLRAYEWCCHLEGLLEEFKQGRLPRVEDGYSADEDEREPLTKIRRVTSWDEPTSAHSDAGSFFEDDYLPSGAAAMKVLQAPSGSGPASPAKKVERDVLDIGYSSENSGQSSDSSEGGVEPPSDGVEPLPAGAESLPAGIEPPPAGIEPLSAGVRRSAVNPTNVRCEVINADRSDSAADDDGGGGAHATAAGRHDDGVAAPPTDVRPGAGGAPDDAAEPFSASQRPAENCATFYFRHADTDTEEPRGGRRRYDGAGSDLEYASPGWPDSDSDWLNNSGLDDSDLECIGFATAQEILSELGEHDALSASPEVYQPQEEAGAAARPLAAPCESEIHRLVERVESLVRADLPRSLPPLELNRQVKTKGRRVREWLRRQHGRRPCEHASAAAAAAAVPVDVSGQVTDSSCDASGEYTTGESEPETASSASEDLTCSMVTCHELATPTNAATPIASPDATTPKVIMRSKKRKSGERPWSLHGLNSAARLRAAPLSVSETALNEMLTPTNEKGVTSSSSNTTVSAGALPKKLPTSASFDSPLWAARRRPSRVHRATAAHSSGSETGRLAGSPSHRRRRSLRSSGSDGERGRTVGGLPAADSHRSSMLSCTTEATLVEMSPRTVSDASPRQPADGHGEEASSVSEQSWDPYQELKEVTEVGSEGSVDPDAVLRLLDCDDYRKYIDSHSDCASSQVSSARGPPRSPFKRSRRKPRALSDSLDSDSDGDELQTILAESRSNLAVVQAELERRSADWDAIYSGVLATCRSELNRLEQVRILVDPLGLGRDPNSPCYKPEVNEVAGVIQKWETLRASAMERQQNADVLGGLRERIRSFRYALVGLDERVARAGAKVAGVDDLQARISAIKTLQQELADRRRELVTVNTDVHSYVSGGGGGGGGDLKDEVATLYRIWEEVDHRSHSQLEQLSALQQTWQTFVLARAELSAVLQADKQKLGVLQEALRTGGDVASRVQDVARVLTDRGRLQDGSAEGAAGLVGSITEPLTAGPDDLSEGTSGYDSACSDDLSERERRLGRLRRLARDLEAVVSPTSPAWSDISHTLSSATSELRELQQSCRDLVIQTAEQFQQEHDTQSGTSLPLSGKSCSPSEHKLTPLGRSGSRHRSWLWRVLRAALPFQLALMLCFCVACLLEPHCCDNLNNLSMSLTPQLRYMRGPPPI